MLPKILFLKVPPLSPRSWISGAILSCCRRKNQHKSWSVGKILCAYKNSALDPPHWLIIYHKSLKSTFKSSASQSCLMLYKAGAFLTSSGTPFHRTVIAIGKPERNQFFVSWQKEQNNCWFDHAHLSCCLGGRRQFYSYEHSKLWRALTIYIRTQDNDLKLQADIHRIFKPYWQFSNCCILHQLNLM